MNNIQKTIHELILNGGCKSKLMLAFKNSCDLDDAREEEKAVKNMRPAKGCKTIVDKNGWVG